MNVNGEQYLKYLKKIMLVIVLVSSSHLIDYGVGEFSSYAVSYYVQSDRNPSLSILESGKLKDRESLSEADSHKIATTAAVIKRIEFFLSLFNATCQLLLVLVFSGFFSLKDRS